LVSDPDVVEADGNKPRQIELAGIGRRGDVVQIDAAQIEDQIGAFDDLARFRLRQPRRLDLAPHMNWLIVISRTLR
jgi:hypothetical protein